MILFSTSKKNVIVHKVPACFNTLGISPYGGENVWVGQGSCVGKTFQSENCHLPFKGLIIHTPLASNRITSRVGAVCGFREEVVWLYKSCCHQCRWRNATVHEIVVLMIFHVSCVSMWTHKCMPMSLNSCPKVHFFQDIFPIPQITNSLVFLSSSDTHTQKCEWGHV